MRVCKKITLKEFVREREALMKNSVIMLDKPSGYTSNDAVQVLKRIMKAKKAGHTGTLDPKVTGLLVTAINNATKIMPVLWGLDKEYKGTMNLHSDISIERLEEAASRFTGKITQMPPVKSAVKRVERERVVRRFRITSFSGKSAGFDVKCEAGTYIRKLIHDMGTELGGAHMASLRRTKVGPFSVEESAALEEISESAAEGKADFLVPIEKICRRAGLKAAVVPDENMKFVLNGVPAVPGWISKAEDAEAGEPVGIFSEDGELIALGRKIGGNEVFAKIERVIKANTN